MKCSVKKQIAVVAADAHGTMNRRQYPGLDIGKFFCSFLILAYHYFSEHGTLPGLLDEALSLYAIAVALFMIISGFLTFDKLERVSDIAGRRYVVLRQVIRILRVYALWSIPYLAYSISNWDWLDIDFPTVLWHLQGWLFRSTFYTIWFMPSLALGLLFSFHLSERVSSRTLYILAMLAYCIGSLSSTYKYFGAMLPGSKILFDFLSAWLGGARGWLTFGFPLTTLGRAIARRKHRLGLYPSLSLAVVSLACLLFEALLLRQLAGHTGIDCAFFTAVTACFLLSFLLAIRVQPSPNHVMMRNMSTLVFMSQRLFLTVLPGLMPELFATLFANYYIGACVVFILTAGFSWMVIMGSNWFPILRNLY